MVDSLGAGLTGLLDELLAEQLDGIKAPPDPAPPEKGRIDSPPALATPVQLSGPSAACAGDARPTSLEVPSSALMDRALREESEVHSAELTQPEA
ncbi:unnamed protein product, partial [Prorocentrum cordatum]